MKIAIINDQHFGVRNDNEHFLSYMNEFYEKIFFPTLDERGIKTIFDLGDTFDRRKYINLKTLSRAREMYFDRVAERNIELHIIVGNHCSYYKNTNEINSCDQLLEQYDNVKVYTRDPVIVHGVGLFPWICADNYFASEVALRNIDVPVIMGHFEIAGFEMYKGQMPNQSGMGQKEFLRFQRVFSGHFHHKSTHGNVTYLGAPYQMTWADHGDDRGFHIFDTETLELEYIKNPFAMFHKVFYDNGDNNETDLESLAGKYVKIIVVNKDNAYQYDQWVNRILEYNPADVQVVEDHKYAGDIDEDDLIDEAEDTETVIIKYVQRSQLRNEADVQAEMVALFREAQSL